MAEPQPIMVFHVRHFIRNLGICKRICVKLLQMICAVIAHNSVENDDSIVINGRATVNYSVSRPPFCPPSWNLWPDLCQTPTDYFGVTPRNSVKKDDSTLINVRVTANYRVSQPSFCQPSWKLFNDLRQNICR